jgi:hypothetical protein
MTHQSEQYNQVCGLKFAALPQDDGLNWMPMIYDVYVIDCGSEEAVRKLETDVAPSFPEDFAACAVQKTRTGNQYVFLQPVARGGHKSSTRALDWTSSNGERMAVDIVTEDHRLVYIAMDTWQQADPADTGRSISHRQPKPMSPELYAYLDEHFVGERRAEKPDDPMDEWYQRLRKLQESYERESYERESYERMKRKREHPEETRPTKSARPLKDP